MSDMTFDKMINQMTPAIYESLKQGVSLRKWPDGRRLTPEQTELCLEAVMRYEVENNVFLKDTPGSVDGLSKIEEQYLCERGDK